MKRAVLAAILCAGLASSVSWAQTPPAPVPTAPAARPIPPQTALANLQATRQYYSLLIGGPTPNIAGLTLFMTMMPKGGDLHHHFSGAVYAETFIDWLKLKNYCIWRADNTDPKAAKFSIGDLAKLSDDAKTNCFDADTVRLAANNGFYRDLLSTWSDKDFYNHPHNVTAPDQHFFDTFFFFGAVSGADYHKGLLELKRRAIAENVQYIETMMLRSPIPQIANEDLVAPLVNLAPDAGDDDVQKALAPIYDFLAADPDTQKSIEQFAKDLEAAADGIDDGDFKARFQTFIVRNDTRAHVFASLYAAFAEAHAGGKVVGVNIVAPENWAVSMGDYSLHMRMFAFLKKKFPEVKLSLHAGELALGMVPPEGLQSHIREAVEVAGAQRIGHGVDIAHERDAPGLMRLMRERKIAVEINLTSNEFILGIKNEAHPLMLYRPANVPYVISTDDAGVSRNNLSGEYVLFASRYRPSYDVVKETVMNSIRFSFLSDADKANELKNLAARFTAFEAKARDLANGLPGATP